MIVFKHNQVIFPIMKEIAKSFATDQLDLVRAKESITPDDVKPLFNMLCSFYNGPLCKRPEYFEGSVKIAKIRAKNEFVSRIAHDLSHQTLERIEADYVFIGITQDDFYTDRTTFVWIPLSGRVYAFKGRPFEIVERPKFFKSKNYDILDCTLDRITYNRGIGYNEVKDTNHTITQENYLRRKYKVHRYCITAIEDTLGVQIKWDGLSRVNGFELEHMRLSYDPMYFLRHKPAEISIETTRCAATLHKIEVNDRC